MRSRGSSPGVIKGTKPPLGPEATKALLEKLLNNPMLPSPPPIALQIIEIVSNPDCQVSDVSSRLKKDPALCAKLLKTLNSCVYALSRPVSSVERAVTILGFHPLRSLILSLTLPAVQIRMEPDQGLKQFWKESVGGAIIARELAHRFNLPLPEDVLVASLVRDLGMILLKQSYPKVYQTLWSNPIELWGEEQCEWECDHIGVHHAEASAALLLRWRLPEEIALPVRYHHHGRPIPGLHPDIQKRTDVLDFSRRLVRLDYAQNSPSQLEQILHIARDQFRLSTTDLEQFLKGIGPQIQEFAGVLQVDIGTCPSYAEVLASGCEALIGLTMNSVQSQTSRDRPPLASPASGRAATPLLSGAATPDAHLEERGNAAEFIIQFLYQRGKLARCVTIQHFEISEVLGRGGMGVVLKARDVKLNRWVAMKMLLPDLINSELARQRFTREAQTAAAIVHENVVGIFAVSEWEGAPFLVMEYIRGASLQDLLDSGRKFSVAEIMSIARQCTAGLAAAHAMRVIHRDIKPANVLMESAGERIRITDFGMARIVDDECKITQDGALTGTPYFMSPEQVNGLPLDQSTDLFSLGSLLYNLCTDKVPFSGKTVYSTLVAVAQERPTPILELNPAIPEKLARIIEDLHIKIPSQRIRSATDLAERLAQIES